MDIRKYRVNINQVWLSRSKYVNFVLRYFHMTYCRPLRIPISMGTDISIEQCLMTPIEMDDMDSAHYATIVGSLIYTMVFTRTYITLAMGVLSHLMDNPRHEHLGCIE